MRISPARAPATRWLWALGLIQLLAWAALLAPWPLRAEGVSVPAEVRQLWPNPHLQGQARLRVLGLHIYDAHLWLEKPLDKVEDWPRQSLALELVYARNLDGERIAERSLSEMQRGGTLDEVTALRWLAQMKRLFPDVKPQDRITGVFQPGPEGGVRFLLNGRLLGEVRDARFASTFIGIWLAPHTSEPGMRSRLLGQEPR